MIYTANAAQPAARYLQLFFGFIGFRQEDNVIELTNILSKIKTKNIVDSLKV